MTQPAKVQEPSMEEILASIRRIIADDEAKPATSNPAPAVAEPPRAATVAPALKPAATNNITPWKTTPPKAARTVAPEPLPPRPVAPLPTASNSQDFDDLLAGLAEATLPNQMHTTEPEPEPVTPALAPPSASQPSFRKVEALDDLKLPAAAGPVRPVNVPPVPVNLPPVFEPSSLDTAQPPILSSSTMSAVESAFNELADTVFGNNARTLDGMVREMIRPMLKSWLDDNLPGLVERIVKAEIERVSRGR